MPNFKGRVEVLRKSVMNYFFDDAELVKNTHASLGARYMSLRHCVEQYSPFGFNQTWEILENKFGLKEGKENTSETLLLAIEFLEQDFKEWLMGKEAKSNFSNSRVKRGLTEPEIIIEHGK